MTKPLSQMQRKSSYGSSLDILLTNPQLVELHQVIRVPSKPSNSKDERSLEKVIVIAKLSQATLKGILDVNKTIGKAPAKALLIGSLKSGQLQPFHIALANAALQREK